MSAKKMNASQIDAMHTRMGEHFANYQAQKKPKSQPKKVAYDWAKKRVVNAERAAHRKQFGIAGDAARANFDHIFR